MRTGVRWTRLPYGDGRQLVYSPRFARTYLLAPDLATSALLPPVLGLSKSGYREQLADPAGSVEPLDGAEFDMAVGRLLPRLYVLFHRNRALASIDSTLRLATWLACLPHERRPWHAPEIGRIVMAVERSVGLSDCYPRSLLTAYLCMSARVSCQVTIGILAPSPSMHAWCSVGGVVPYEPEPQHWFYSPLAVFDVTP